MTTLKYLIFFKAEQNRQLVVGFLGENNTRHSTPTGAKFFDTQDEAEETYFKSTFKYNDYWILSRECV